MITDKVLSGFKETEIKMFVNRSRPEIENQGGDYTGFVARNVPKLLPVSPHYMLLCTSTGYGNPGNYFHFEIKNNIAVVQKVSDALEIKALADVRKLSRNFPR